MNHRILLVAAAVLVVAGCRLNVPTAEPAPSGPVAVTGPVVATLLPPVSQPPNARAELAKLTIDDRPYTGPAYRREDWPHWKDLDHNGCDTREDALIVASLDKPHVARGCRVTAGRWPLVYVSGETTDPGQVDVDHVVPLGNAARSGGGSWSTAQRTAYANDPAVLWVVDDGANQAKSDRSPDQWRPPQYGVWCEYARRFVTIKVTYQLTVTTAERDALGEMFDTCSR